MSEFQGSPLWSHDTAVMSVGKMRLKTFVGVLLAQPDNQVALPKEKNKLVSIIKEQEAQSTLAWCVPSCTLAGAEKSMEWRFCDNLCVDIDYIHDIVDEGKCCEVIRSFQECYVAVEEKWSHAVQ